LTSGHIFTIIVVDYTTQEWHITVDKRNTMALSLSWLVHDWLDMCCLQSGLP